MTRLLSIASIELVGLLMMKSMMSTTLIAMVGLALDSGDTAVPTSIRTMRVIDVLGSMYLKHLA